MATTTQTYNVTGAPETHVLDMGSPTGAADVLVRITGGGGGGANKGFVGGHGQIVEFTIPGAKHGDTLTFEVGEGGDCGTINGPGGAASYPDGGQGGNPDFADVNSSAGGGSTRVYLNGTLIAVAGAGGGACWRAAGNAGYPAGSDGERVDRGSGEGGSQTEGGGSASGPAGSAWWGDYLYGGSGIKSAHQDRTIKDQTVGAGGGGGYYGGAGGVAVSTRNYPSGGGGSSWVAPAYIGSATFTSANNGGVNFAPGGDGQAYLEYTPESVISPSFTMPGPVTVTPPQSSTSIDGKARYDYTGAPIQFTITEDSVVRATIAAAGGGGGVWTAAAPSNTGGGDGGLTVVEFFAKAGQVVEVWIGQGGQTPASYAEAGGLGGWPDGGDAGKIDLGQFWSAGGGGSTRILLDGEVVAVAGGGGGSAWGGGAGGDGGGEVGQNGFSTQPAQVATGGTQDQGGIASPRPNDLNPAGGPFKGGNGWPDVVPSRTTTSSVVGGGGGGGWFGGAGGAPTAVRNLPDGAGGSGYLNFYIAFTGETFQGQGAPGGPNGRDNIEAQSGQNGYLLLAIDPINSSDIVYYDLDTPIVVDLSAPEGALGAPAEAIGAVFTQPISVVAPVPPVFAIGEPLPAIMVDGRIGGLGTISVTLIIPVSDDPVEVSPPVIDVVSAGAGNNPEDQTPQVITVGSPQFELVASVLVDQPIIVTMSPMLAQAAAATGFDLSAPISGPVLTPVDGDAVSIASFNFAAPFEIDLTPADGVVPQDGVFELVSFDPVLINSAQAIAFELLIFDTVPTPDVTITPPEAAAGDTLGFILSSALVVDLSAADAEAGGGLDFVANPAFQPILTSPPLIILQLSAGIFINRLGEIQINYNGGEAFEAVEAEVNNELVVVDLEFLDAVELEAGADYSTSNPDTGLVVDLTASEAEAIGEHQGLLLEPIVVEVKDEIGGLGRVNVNILTPPVDYDVEITDPMLGLARGGTQFLQTELLGPVFSFAAQSIFAVAFEIDPLFTPVSLEPALGEGVIALAAPAAPFDTPVTIEAVTGEAVSIAEVEVPETGEFIELINISAPDALVEFIADATPAPFDTDILITAMGGIGDVGLDVIISDPVGPVQVVEMTAEAVGNAGYDVARNSDFGGHWRVNLVQPLNPGAIDQVDGFATAGANADETVFAGIDPVQIEPALSTTQLTAQIFSNFLPRIEVEVPQAYTHQDVIDAVLPLQAVKVRAPDGYVEVEVQGFSPLRYKRSTTPEALPASLALREIALNEMDGRLIWTDGVDLQIAELGILADYGLPPLGGSDALVLRGNRTWGAVEPTVDLPVRPMPKLGEAVYLSQDALELESRTPDLDTVYYRPFFLSRAVTLIQLGVDVVTGAAGSATDVGIVRWSPSAEQPLSTVTQSSFDTSLSGQKAELKNIQLPAGWYAAAFVVTGPSAPIFNTETATARLDQAFSPTGDRTASYAATLDPAPLPSARIPFCPAFVKGALV